MLSQQLQDAWQHIVEFFKHPSFLRFFIALVAVIAFLGGVDFALKEITGHNVLGALLHVIIDLARSIGNNLHTKATSPIWVVMALSIALFVVLSATAILYVLRRLSVRRIARLAVELKEEKEKGESYRREADAAKESESVSRHTLTQLDKVTFAIQAAAEDIIAEAEVWRQVLTKFVFYPRQAGDAAERGSSVDEELVVIRARYERINKALHGTELLLDVVSDLVEQDKELAAQVIKLIKRSIDQQRTTQPESITSASTEEKVRNLFLEALAHFGTQLALAEYQSHGGDGLKAMFTVLKGREEVARKIIGRGQTADALNGLLDFAIDFARPLFHADRGFIFIPDLQGQELVRCAATHLNVIELTHPSTFYIGDSAYRTNERGVAGNAYIRKEPIACHWNAETGRYEDKYDAAAHYMRGKRYTKEQPPDYQSFIAIPLYGPLLRRSESDSEGSATMVEGVLCLDGRAPNLFQDHFLLNTEIGYQQPPISLIGVIFELAQWRRGLGIQHP